MNHSTFQQRRRALSQIGALGLSAATLSPTRLFAAVFLDVAQAQKLLLPSADAFEPLALSLTPSQLDRMASDCGQRVPKNFAPQCWTAMQEHKRVGWVLVDRVIGKVDLIDYAVGFDALGAITGVEILAYRETHGAEIRQAAWRGQFTGRKSPSQIRFQDDIRNISGATLSCQHVTDGVQRLSACVAFLTKQAS